MRPRRRAPRSRRTLPRAAGRWRAWVPLALAALATGACGPRGTADRAPAPPPGPELVRLDSLRLRGADGLALRGLHSMTVDPYDGSLHVSDSETGRAHRFARDGRLLRTYGGGRGGEGRAARAGEVLVPDRGRVVLADVERDRLLLFERGTGGFLRRVPLPGEGRPARGEVGEGTVWIHRLRTDSARGLVRWRVGGGPAASLGAVPGAYRRSLSTRRASFARFFSHGAVTGWRGRLVHGWSGSGWLFVQGRDGAIRDSVPLPAVRRKALADRLQERVDGGEVPGARRFGLGAMLADVRRLDGGRVAVVHWDRGREAPAPEGRPSAGRWLVWLGLLGRDLERACMDRLLPPAGALRPVGVAFRGDTLFQLVRRPPPGESPGPLETWVRVFGIGAEGCDWVSTAR